MSRRRIRVRGVGVAVVLWLLTGPSWAKNESQPLNQSLPKPSQELREAAPSGNIISYQPILTSALAGVASYQPPQPATAPGQPLPPPPAYDYTTWLVGQGPYTLGRDDVIRVQVRNQADFSGDFIVGPDGYIQYNYLGDIPVVGMTKYEVEQVLTKLLEPYIRVPQVSLTILAYNSKAVYVIGEVSRPGKYIMRGDTIKLREAIIAAGLPTRTAALWRTHVIKPDLKNPRVRKVNLKTILYRGALHEDIDLYPGEIVVVPSTVISAINNFLSQLLNPITRAAAAAAIGVGL